MPFLARRENARIVDKPAQKRWVRQAHPTFLSSQWLAAALVLAACGLRAAPLLENRFHPDEALYATFGRLIASGHDPLLSTVVVDKPPLPFYLMAVSMSVLGGTELAARLPTVFAAIVSIAVLYQLGRTLYGGQAGLAAALLLAASPLAILFAITLFTDTLLAAFLSLSLLGIARQRWALAGWAFGLAFACKQSALFFLPLILALAWIAIVHHKRYQSWKDIGRWAAAFVLPILICTIVIFGWDYSRHASISFWVQGYADNSPNRLVRANELWPRWWAWLDLLQYFSGTPILNGLLIAGLPVLLIFNRRSLAGLYDYVLAGFALTFLMGYWLLAFNVWDRYLVILGPIVALLGGRLFERSVAVLRQIRPLPSRAIAPVLFAAVAVCLTPPALVSAGSGYPIGGDHGAYEGIDQIAQSLQKVPPGSVLYDHWLSWELGFYLFDGPAYVAWMPGPSTLTDDLKAFGRRSNRYIVSPQWESFSEMQTAIEEAGFETKVLQQTYRRDGSLSFTLYEIVPR